MYNYKLDLKRNSTTGLTLTYLGYFASLNSWGGAIMAPP